MLNEILDVCKETPRGVCLEEIAARLGKEPSVIGGMVDQLLRMGKLVEHQGQTLCESCPMGVSCALHKHPDQLYSSE